MTTMPSGFAAHQCDSKGPWQTKRYWIDGSFAFTNHATCSVCGAPMPNLTTYLTGKTMPTIQNDPDNSKYPHIASNGDPVIDILMDLIVKLRMRSDEQMRDKIELKNALTDLNTALEDAKKLLTQRDEARQTATMWEKSATQYYNTYVEYQNRLKAIGEAIGEEAYTCDDGTRVPISEGPLLGKVTELAVKRIKALHMFTSNRDPLDFAFDVIRRELETDEKKRAMLLAQLRQWFMPLASKYIGACARWASACEGRVSESAVDSGGHVMWPLTAEAEHIRDKGVAELLTILFNFQSDAVSSQSSCDSQSTPPAHRPEWTDWLRDAIVRDVSERVRRALDRDSAAKTPKR
jgi:hypothetical protein